MDYIALIHQVGTSDFGVSFPDFPGCTSAGRTLGEAKTMAAEALNLCLEEMRAFGETIPSPTPLAAITADPEFGDASAFLAVTALEPEAEGLLEFTRLSPWATGLPITIWIAHDNPLVFGGELQAITHPLQALRQWVVLNLPALRAHWSGEIDGPELTRRLRPVRPVHPLTEVKMLTARKVQLFFADDPTFPIVDLSPILIEGSEFEPLHDPVHWETVKVGPQGRALVWRVGEAVIELSADRLWLMAQKGRATDAEDANEQR